MTYAASLKRFRLNHLQLRKAEERERKVGEEERLIAWHIVTQALDIASLDARQQEAFLIIDNFVNPPKDGDGAKQIVINLFT